MATSVGQRLQAVPAADRAYLVDGDGAGAGAGAMTGAGADGAGIAGALGAITGA